METLNLVELRLDFKLFGIELFIIIIKALIMTAIFAFITPLPFISLFGLLSKLILILCYHLRRDMFGCSLKKIVPKHRLIFAVQADLAPVWVLFVVVGCLLVAIGRSLWCDANAVIALFFPEGRPFVFHFITKNIFLICSEPNFILLIHFLC